MRDALELAWDDSFRTLTPGYLPVLVWFRRSPWRRPFRYLVLGLMLLHVLWRITLTMARRPPI